MLSLQTGPSGLSYVVGITCALAASLDSARSESDRISSAANYCLSYRNSVTISDDHTILCFDGKIDLDQASAPFHQLKQNGFFIVRSPGGAPHVAINLSNILRKKNATVIIYDYCLSACANYFLIASFKTYILKSSIVAWHGGPPKVGCNAGNIEHVKKYLRDWRYVRDRDGIEIYPSAEVLCQTIELEKRFFKEREIEDRHIHQPQTEHTQTMTHFAMIEPANRRRVLWMWNPKNYGDYFKSRIVYESYPSSQDEVDEILSRLQLGIRVIYDP